MKNKALVLALVLAVALATVGLVAVRSSQKSTTHSSNRAALVHEAAEFAQKLSSGIRPAKLTRVNSTHGTVTEIASFNWSGYADAATDERVTRCGPQDGCQSVSSVSGSWTIPQVTCPAPPFNYENNIAAVWIGIDGFNDTTVEQTGTESFCFEGEPTYITWYEMYPSGTVFVRTTAAAGDAITASVTLDSGQPGFNGNPGHPGFPAPSGKAGYHLTLTDATHSSDSITTVQPCGASTCLDDSAEWIIERPFYETSTGLAIGLSPLSDFGKSGFSNASEVVNGKTTSLEGYAGQGRQDNLYEMNMLSATESYYLDCMVQSAPVGSLLHAPTPTTGNSRNTCPPTAPTQPDGFSATWDATY